MKKSRFSKQQIINILKEADAGMKMQGLCRQYGISNAIYYKVRGPKRSNDQDGELIEALNQTVEKRTHAGASGSAMTACG
jgi:hypothetical protein